MRYKLKNSEKFGWDGLNGWAYNSKDDFPNASAAYFEITGKHGETKATRSDRIYYVIDGQGEFKIGGKIIPVEKTDVVIAPKNVSYDYKAINGTMKLFLVHTPAFDPDAEVTFPPSDDF